MKKYLLLILGLIVITLTSCNVPKQDYVGVNEYCCGEVCCEGYEHFEEYYVGNNTVEVKELEVNNHIHKIVSTKYYH